MMSEQALNHAENFPRVLNEVNSWLCTRRVVSKLEDSVATMLLTVLHAANIKLEMDPDQKDIFGDFSSNSASLANLYNLVILLTAVPLRALHYWAWFRQVVCSFDVIDDYVYLYGSHDCLR